MDGRLEVLEEAFKYANNLQERLQKCFAGYLVAPVSGVQVQFVIDDDNYVVLNISWEAADGVDTFIRFVDEDAVEIEVELPEGTQTWTCSEVDQVCLFDDDFDGIVLTHKVPYGRYSGIESHECKVLTRVPPDVRDAQVAVAMQTGDEELWSNEKVRIRVIEEKLEDIKRTLEKQCTNERDGTSKRRRKQYWTNYNQWRFGWQTPPWHKRRRTNNTSRKRLICFQHHPARGRVCRKLYCDKEHIDTTKELARYREAKERYYSWRG